MSGSFPNAPLLRPLGVGEIIDIAIKVYKANFGTLLKLVAIVVVPVQVLSALIQTSVSPDSPTSFGPSFQPGVTPTVDATDVWAFVVGVLVTLVLGFLATQLATAASLKAVADAYLGERPDWRASLSFAFQRLGPLVWLALISAIPIGIGFVLCLVPGIWLAVSWSVAVPVLLVEGVRGTSSLGRSFQLVRPRFWPTLGVVALGRLVAYVLGIVIAIPVTLSLFFAPDNEFMQFVVAAISSSISTTLTTPFLAATIAIMYFDLRVRREGLDLELLVQRIGEAPGDAPAPAPRRRSAPAGLPASSDPDAEWRPSDSTAPAASGERKASGRKPPARKPTTRKPVARKPVARKPAARKPVTPKPSKPKPSKRKPPPRRPGGEVEDGGDEGP